MLRNIRSMHSVTGVLADYAQDGSMDNDETARKVYHPVYEYDWGGETGRRKADLPSLRKNKGVRIFVRTPFVHL